MDYQTIDEIYDFNKEASEKLCDALSDLSTEERKMRFEDEKWSIEEIVEHISIVEEGMAKICRKLLRKAREEGTGGPSKVSISEGYRNKSVEIATLKVEAPEIVHPTGTRTIEDSSEKMAQNQLLFDEIRPMFNEVDGIEMKFPHPFLGPLSAQEWLLLSGEHKIRHIGQIKRVLTKARQ